MYFIKFVVYKCLLTTYEYKSKKIYSLDIHNNDIEID